MNKKSVYLDATVPSTYCDTRESMREFTTITRKWWKEESRGYQIYVSESTIAECLDGKYPNKEKVVSFVLSLPSLVLNEQIERIAATYIREFVMPRKWHGYAFHLATASYYRIDFLLTWNCEHLANKLKHIAAVNFKLGLFVPDIITPMMLFTERDE